jgi:TolB protein
MCETYAGQKGFALDRIAFVSRKGKDVSELCVCYPDGYDIRQLTGNGKTVVGPRWKSADSIFYTGIVNAGPQIWEYDLNTGRRSLKWSFKGLSTGASVSPDGQRVAIILSFQGNPELYVIHMASSKWTRLTNTPLASEGQPAWSPDGRKIVYVSDETRHPQLYVIDVATKAKRRLTSRGSQNIDPDWGPDGRIAYITKRGGAQVAIMDPAAGEGSVKLVTAPGNWEHPSWSRDRRNIVAGRDKALFVVDTEIQFDKPVKPRQVFHAQGNWINPSWSR